jgi:hypothetical protein
VGWLWVARMGRMYQVSVGMILRLRSGQAGGEEVELVGAVDDVAGADGADPFGRYRSLRAGSGVVALIDGAFDLDAAEEAVVAPFVAVAPQGRLWRRRRGRFLPRVCCSGIRARRRIA